MRFLGAVVQDVGMQWTLQASRAQRVGTALLALLSIPIWQIVYQGSYRVAFDFDHFHDGYFWIVDLGIPTLLFAATVFALTAQTQSLGRPRLSSRIRRAAVVGCGIWLVIFVVLASGSHHSQPFAVPSNAAGKIGDVSFAVLAEEMYFRGALFDRLQELARWHWLRLPAAVWITSALFGLMHLGNYGFHPGATAAKQVIFTFLLGLALGWLRYATGSLWPSVGLHSLINALSLVS